MEDDGGYIVMSKAKGQDPSPRPTPRGAGTSHPWCCYRGAVVLLSLLLIPAVILLSIHIFQERGDTCSQATLAQLKQSLCDPAQDGTSAEGECKLCPQNWLAYREKCYWLSKQSWVWNESRRDCEGRRARMLIIRDPEEMNFISNITERSDHVWIGLHLPGSAGGWTWVDGAPLDQLLFRVSGNAEKESCGVVKAQRINSESCQAEFKWVCERAATRM